jgi:hypothetical protein
LCQQRAVNRRGFKCTHHSARSNQTVQVAHSDAT